MLPVEALRRVLYGIRYNLKRIDPVVDSRFGVRTIGCGLIDDPLRPEDIKWQQDDGVQGMIVTVMEDTMEYEYLTAARVRCHLTYNVQAWLFSADGSLVREALWRADSALWVAHWYDLALDKADAALNGTTLNRLVSNHRIKSTSHEFEPPNAVMRSTVMCIYDFQADAAS